MTPRRFQRLASILDRRQIDLTVLMDNVHKPHNVSAIIRTLDAVGILDLHAVSPDSDFRARHVSASGAERWVRVITHRDHRQAATELRELGMQIIAADPHQGAVDFRSIDYRRPTALLLGSELDGLSREGAAQADRSVVIPMLGAVASLNVSVAAAVILFEAQRQRLEAGHYARTSLAPETRARLLFEWAYPRLADFCRKKGVRYPRLDAQGNLLDPLPRG